MSFLCNFPLYSNSSSPLETETLFSIDLKTNSSTVEENTTYSSEKEIKFNLEEQKNTNKWQTNLQNLVLTTKASHNGEPTPIKCQWRRMKYDSERLIIKYINSFSYIPNSQDIGYWI